MLNSAIMHEDTLVRHMRVARRYPMLDSETEADLARRWRDERDPEAADRLVGSHQRLVVKIANEYRGYGLPLADLVSEGNVGLMQAVVKFDPDLGYRLSTYAMWWIRAAITDYVLRTSSLVRMATNEHQKRLFFNLRRLKAKHQGPREGVLTPQSVEAIAKELGVPESEIVLMDRRLGFPDLSLNASAGDGEADSQWQDFLVDDSESQEATVIRDDERKKRQALLEEALEDLDERERHILVERKLKEDPPKLSDLAAEYGISRERVRQLEARALGKLRTAMRKAAAESGLLSLSHSSGNEGSIG
jgi:RNA polymerase sigma-32 factor